MEKIIIEIIHPGAHQGEFRVYDSFPVTVGRSFENHIILSDPYVSPHHLEVSSDAEGIIVKEKGGENGVTINKEQYVSTDVKIKHGAHIQCGQTVLKLHSAESELEKTRIFYRMPVFMQRLSHPYPSLLFVILMCLFAALSFRMDSHEKDFFSETIGVIAILLIGSMIWTAGWAFVGRVLKHKAIFFGHLSICSIFFLWIFIFSDVGEYAAYVLSSHTVQVVFNIIHIPMGIALLFYGSMSLATPMKRGSKIALVSTLAILLASIMITTKMDEETSQYPKINKSLYPPKFTPFKGETLDSFLKEAGKI